MEVTIEAVMRSETIIVLSGLVSRHGKSVAYTDTILVPDFLLLNTAASLMNTGIKATAL